jgi:EAL domain-containing protein (putative c-di-GMP-specific phosphodiesterase class I)/signal transduction histidine kinase/DNA-binding response OmpR family regulator
MATLVLDGATGDVSMLSTKASELLGCSQAEIPSLEALWQQLFPDSAYRQRVRTEWEGAVAKAGQYLGQAALLLAKVTGKDGSQREIEFHIKPVRGSLMVSMVDITGHHRQEEMLRNAKEAAEEASKTKSRFLSSMTHEVRTPLNAIMGHAQLLTMDSNLDAQQRSSLLEIERAGKTLLGLINNVLDLARMETEPISLDLGDIPLDEILDQSRKDLAVLAQERRVRLDVADCHGIWLRADRQRLVQVVNNLLSNAIKFNREGDSVTVRPLPAAPGRFRLAIEDTGQGIPADKLHRLFQPFDRLGAERSSIQGSGIGLVIARKLMDGMGGTLGVESQYGKGSTFWLDLPLAEGLVAAAEAAGPRILVAEDNGVNQILLKMQLRKLGYQVDAVGDGAAALERWRAHHYDLLLTDCAMPALDGYDLTAAIRSEERPSGRRIPIVACSANARDEVMVQGGAVGMDDYLAKPVSIEALGEMLGKWLAHAARQAQTGPAARAEAGPAGERATGSARYLAALREIMGGDVSDAAALELLKACDEAVQLCLEEARAARAGLNHEAFFQAMHKLKASVRMIGADDLASLAQKLESAGRSADWTCIQAGIPQLEAALAALGAELGTVTAAVAVGATAPAALQTDFNAGPSLAHLGILVVDDDPLIRNYVSELLKRRGVVRLFQASEGTEALKTLIVRGPHIDVVLCDLNMPGMDGVELIRHIGELDFRGSIVFISGEDSRVLNTVNELAQSHGLTTLGVLEKPFKAGQLYDLLGLHKAGGRAKKVVQGDAPALDADELRAALENDELTIYLQPKVDAHSLQVVGAEALARWPRAQGFVSPGLFIPVAEASGLIDTLFQRLFSKTVEFGSRLHAAGHKLSLAVNVSALSLSSLDIPDFVINEASRHGFDPAYLILEVTESGVLRDMRTALDVLSRLRLRRVNLSIDDFGTGYASMDQLRRIPFGELKVDRSFVGGALKDNAARSILESSVEMARKMGLKIVAEGVETEAELALVRGLGCHLVQGFHIARPMDMDNFMAWLAAR